MKSLKQLLFPTCLVMGQMSVASAQDCEGNLIDTIDDRCRASFIEVETADQGLRRLYDGDQLCFRPRQQLRWIWFCRGYEESARCRTKYDGTVSIMATMEKGRVQWRCYGH